MKLFDLPEQTECRIEADDDIDFSDPDEGKLLASLKHKASGDTLTDLSPDFWKSVRIWVTYFIEHKDEAENASFFLFTTGQVSVGSFLESFLPNKSGSLKREKMAARAMEVLDTTKSQTILKSKALLGKLSEEERGDFFARILIFDCQERIDEIPQKVMDKMRTVRSKFRKPVFERLEGWWTDQCINLLTGKRTAPLSGREMSENLARFADQYRDDDLPIDFLFAKPEEDVDPETDDRLFVRQLREIGLGSDRIGRSILDYYRAFEQRSSWARTDVILQGEMEEYDDRLVDEWARVRESACDELEEGCSEEVLQATGKKILNELSSTLNENLRIRPRVTATFVTVGSYHILANESTPRVHWHPLFMDRLAKILEGGAS